MRTGSQDGAQRRVGQGHVLAVGKHHEGSPATVQGLPYGNRDRPRPPGPVLVGARQGGPHGAGRAALRQSRQERLPLPVVRPRPRFPLRLAPRMLARSALASLFPPRHGPCALTRSALASSSRLRHTPLLLTRPVFPSRFRLPQPRFSCLRLSCRLFGSGLSGGLSLVAPFPRVPTGLGSGIGGGGLRLDPGVAGRDGQAQHVGHGPGVVVGHDTGQRGDLRGEHGLGGDDPLQAGQLALVLGALHPFQQEAVDELAREPDPDPAPRHRGGVQGAGTR